MSVEARMNKTAETIGMIAFGIGMVATLFIIGVIFAVGMDDVDVSSPLLLTPMFVAAGALMVASVINLVWGEN